MKHNHPHTSFSSQPSSFSPLNTPGKKPRRAVFGRLGVLAGLLLFMSTITGCQYFSLATVAPKCREVIQGQEPAAVRQYGRENVKMVYGVNSDGEYHCWLKIRHKGRTWIVDNYCNEMPLMPNDAPAGYTEIGPFDPDNPPDLTDSQRMITRSGRKWRDAHAPRAGDRIRNLWPGGHKPTGE